MSLTISPSPFGSLVVSVAETGSTLSVTTVATSPSVLTMALGVPGPAGEAGEPGANGQNGVGVAAGGTTGQALVKLSGTNYDTGWATITSGGGTWGSITGTLSSQTDLYNALNGKLSLTGGTMSGAILFDPVGGQNIAKGSFDSGRGGYNGISLNCANLYELNWQSGYLKNIYNGSVAPINVESEMIFPVDVNGNDSLVGPWGFGVENLDAGQSASIEPNQIGITTDSYGVEITSSAVTRTNPDGETFSLSKDGVSGNQSPDLPWGLNASGVSGGYIADGYFSLGSDGVYFGSNATEFPASFTNSGIRFFDQTLQTTAFPGYTGTTSEYIDGTGDYITFPEVGDRYLTTSTSTLTIDNGNGKTMTVETGLSYSTQQDIVVSHNASNHMHGTVVSYNPSTGVMVFDANQHTGSGTYSSWEVNVGGVNGAILPVAGTAGQVLAKVDGTNFNTEWISLGNVALNNYATNLQAVQNTSATTVLSPANSRFAGISTNIWSPGVTGLSSAVSGTGANAGSTVTSLNGALLAPNTTTAGYATRGFNLYFPSNSINNGYNFGTASGHSVKVYSSAWASTVTGVKMRAVFGRMSASLPVPATLAARGYGWEWDYSTKVISIIAHNGSSLTTTAQTWTPVSLRTYDIAVYSNGAGTISLYIDGTLIGTGTGGPTDTNSTSQIWWQMEIQNEATAGSQQTIFYQNPKLITTNG